MTFTCFYGILDINSDKTFQKKATVVAIFPIQKRERKLNIAFDSVKPYFGLGLHCCFVLAVTIMFYETK